MTRFTAAYDKEADVLYSCIDDPEPCTTDEGSMGLMFRTSMWTGLPNGVTVMDFSTYNLDELSRAIQGFLKVVTLSEVYDKLVTLKVEQRA